MLSGRLTPMHGRLEYLRAAISASLLLSLQAVEILRVRPLSLAWSYWWTVRARAISISLTTRFSAIRRHDGSIISPSYLLLRLSVPL